MQQTASGFSQLLDIQVIRALLAFDRDYRRSGYNMTTAGHLFLNHSGYQPHVERSWQTQNGAILFIGEHSSVLDGFAMSLACPADRDLRRIMFLPTGYMLGRHFARRNVLVWPKMSWTNLWNESRSLRGRLSYLITHRAGPFAYFGPWSKSGRHVEEICQLLRNETCVSLLPSGVVGAAPWRSGIGAILCDYERRRELYRGPLHIAPVYTTWQAGKRVRIEAPLLVAADRLLLHLRRLGVAIDRRILTQTVKEAYRSRDWPGAITQGFAA